MRTDGDNVRCPSRQADNTWRGIPDGNSVLLPAAQESAAPVLLLLLIRNCLKLNVLCNQPNPLPPPPSGQATHTSQTPPTSHFPRHMLECGLYGYTLVN